MDFKIGHYEFTKNTGSSNYQIIDTFHGAQLLVNQKAIEKSIEKLFKKGELSLIQKLKKTLRLQ